MLTEAILEWCAATGILVFVVTHWFLKGRYVGRSGIYGRSFDRASGKALDRMGDERGVTRERAVLLGYRLPWLQRDETYRRRMTKHVMGNGDDR